MHQYNLIFLALMTLSLSACILEGEKGSKGDQGEIGNQGLSGINCWDLNGNRVNDLSEDINNDGSWSVADCNLSPAGEQHPEAQYNFQHFCEAFANLGQYPEGCPSSSHTPPAGTLRAMIPGEFNGSYQTCSDLSIAVNNNQAYWSLENSFVASSELLDISERDRCEEKCRSDSQCVASEWHLRAGVGAGDCQIYYHSDSLSIPYQRLCGVDVPSVGLTAADACLIALSSDTVWNAICP